VQKLYAVTGAFFVPMLALALILLNGRSKWVGAAFQNRAVTTISLSVTVAFFLWIAITKMTA